MIWIKLVKDVIKRMYCIFVKVQNIYTGLKGGSIMQNYIVSFLMFGIYLFIESVLKTKTINMNLSSFQLNFPYFSRHFKPHIVK